MGTAYTYGTHAAERVLRNNKNFVFIDFERARGEGATGRRACLVLNSGFFSSRAFVMQQIFYMRDKP
jgi:hypothetical protein